MCPAENFSPAGFLLATLAEGEPHARVDKKTYRPETRLVHAGTLRSQFNEMSEALFLTQGYVYPSAEECELRFSGKIPGYVYSRYSNPTMDMFEQRMAALEGAEAARSTATGMAAVTTALMGLVRAGDHVVAAKALFGSCRWVIEEWLPRFGVPCTLVDGKDFECLEEGGAEEHQGVLHGDADQPDAGSLRHPGGRRHRAQRRRQAGGRQRVRHPALPEPAHPRRRLRGLFGDQTYRRTGPRARRRHSGVRKIHHGPRASGVAPDRTVAVAVQRLGHAQEPGNLAGAGGAADRDRGRDLDRARPGTRRSCG